METVAFHDPFFTPVLASAVSRDHIADLAAGRCAAIQVSDFLPGTVCEEILKALAAAQFESYNIKRIYPEVLRFGVGVSDHNAHGTLADSYWAALDSNRLAWRSLSLDYDPFELCRRTLAAEWPHPISVATHRGREMGPGVVREPNGGFQVHFDDAKREFSGNLVDANLIAQFAFNLYLSVPDNGGETIIWRHRWNPADEQHRLPHSTYGYSEAVVQDDESFELTPSVGSALLLDPRNFHAVRASQDSRRVAIGFAVGLTDMGDLLTWG